MFLLALLVVCIATVPIAGGRLGRLADIEFERAGAAVLAVAGQILILAVFPGGDRTLHALVHVGTYGLMFYFLAANLRIPGVWLIGIGGGCNALAIAANDGVMPAQPSALATAGIEARPGEFVNSAAIADAKLWFLGDIFAVPADWPLANVFSIGDVLLVMGAFVLLHRVCGSRLAAPMLRLADRLGRTGPRLALLREQRAFRRLWVAQVVSAVGDFVYPVAVFTAVVDERTSVSSLAFLLIAQFGPGMVVGIFGGPLIDRFSRKRLMIVTDLLRGVAVASLLLVGDPTLTHLYAVAVCLGVGSALFEPAFLAALPNIVPRRHLAAANAFVGVTLAIAVSVGHVLGVVIVKQIGVEFGFVANAATFFFSAALVAGTVFPAGAARPAGTRLLSELVLGLRYILRTRVVLGVLIVVGLITLAAGLRQPLEPLFALRALDAGPLGYGLLGAFWGAGMVAAVLIAAPADRRLGHGRLLTTSTAVAGGAVVLASASPSLSPVLILWLFAGAANTLGTVAYETLIQEETPDYVRGRVFAALEASIQAGLLAGVGLSTLADPALGAHPSRPGFAISGVIFGIAAFVSWRMLQRRRGARTSVDAVRVRDLELVPAGPTRAVLLLATEGVLAEAPVLLVDDGSSVHRVNPSPARVAGRIAYNVPGSLLALKRTALALDLNGLGLVDLPRPVAALRS